MAFWNYGGKPLGWWIPRPPPSRHGRVKLTISKKVRQAMVKIKEGVCSPPAPPWPDMSAKMA